MGDAATVGELIAAARRAAGYRNQDDFASSVHTMRHHLEPGVAWQQLSGKVIVAANPWPLAATAKQLGLRDVEFRELDDIPDDTAYVINLDQLAWMPCYRFTDE